MSVLIKLPSVLCSSILNEWLIPQEWLILDSAFTSSKLRSDYLEELKLIKLVLGSCYSSSRSYSVSFHRWIFAKSIKLHTYILGDKHFEDGKLLFEINYSYVSGLFSKVNDDSGIIDVINFCYNLKELELYDRQVLSINESILCNVQSITVNTSKYEVYANSLRRINKFCTKLREYFSGYCKGNLDEEMKLLVKQNNEIKSIAFVGSLNLLDFIVNTCNNLTDIIYTCTDDIDLTTIEKLLKANISFNILQSNTQKLIEFSESKRLLTLRGLQDTEAIEIMSYASNIKSLTISDHIVTFIDSRFFTSLTSLDISCDCVISQDYFQELLLNCPLLTDLALKYFGNIETIFVVPNHLKSLLLIDITGECNLMSMIAVLKVCPCLKYFYIGPIKSEDESLIEFEKEIKNFSTVETKVYYKNYGFKIFNSKLLKNY